MHCGVLIQCFPYKQKPTQKKTIADTLVSQKTTDCTTLPIWQNNRNHLNVAHPASAFHIVLSIPIMRTSGISLGFFYGNSSFLKYCVVVWWQSNFDRMMTLYHINFFFFAFCSSLSLWAYKACSGLGSAVGSKGGNSSIRRIRDSLLSVQH